MSEHGNQNRFMIDFEDQVVGKLFQIATAARVIQSMESGRMFLNAFHGFFKGREEAITRRVGAIVVVFENLSQVPPNRRVKEDLHFLRESRNSSKNSALGMP